MGLCVVVVVVVVADDKRMRGLRRVEDGLVILVSVGRIQCLL